MIKAVKILLLLVGTISVSECLATYPVYICRASIGHSGNGDYAELYRKYEYGRNPDGTISYVDITVTCMGNGPITCSLVLTTLTENTSFNEFPIGLQNFCISQWDNAVNEIVQGIYTGQNSQQVAVQNNTGGFNNYLVVTNWNGTNFFNTIIELTVHEIY